jgi:hypothetical protein
VLGVETCAGTVHVVDAFLVPSLEANNASHGEDSDEDSEVDNGHYDTEDYTDMADSKQSVITAEELVRDVAQGRTRMRADAERRTGTSRSNMLVQQGEQSNRNTGAGRRLVSSHNGEDPARLVVLRAENERRAASRHRRASCREARSAFRKARKEYRAKLKALKKRLRDARKAARKAQSEEERLVMLERVKGLEKELSVLRQQAPVRGSLDSMSGPKGLCSTGGYGG